METKIYKASSLVKAPKSALEAMKKAGAKYAYFTNGSFFSGQGFVASITTVEKMAHNKFCMKKEDRLEISDNEVIKIDILADEYLYEMDANSVDFIKTKEGFDGKEVRVITRFQSEAAVAIKHGLKYDFEKLFK